MHSTKNTSPLERLTKSSFVGMAPHIEHRIYGYSLSGISSANTIACFAFRNACRRCAGDAPSPLRSFGVRFTLREIHANERVNSARVNA